MVGKSISKGGDVLPVGPGVGPNAVNLSLLPRCGSSGRHSGGSRNPVFSGFSGPRLSPGWRCKQPNFP